METNWTKADFKSSNQLEGASGDRLRLSQEALARDLSIGLSAFLRTNIPVTHAGGEQIVFDDVLKHANPSCFGLALIRPDQRRILLRLECSALFPLIGIALGAKLGSFASPERQPTDIELQVVALLFRMIASETARSWSALLKTPLETIAVEFEQTPTRVFAITDSVFVSHFEVGAEQHKGRLSLVAPLDLLAGLVADQNVPVEQPAPGPRGGTAESTLQLLMPAKVSLDIWLDGSQMRLGDLLQLCEGQVIKLDHPVERRAVCTLNGKPGFTGQIVSTGTARAFMVEDFAG